MNKVCFNCPGQRPLRMSVDLGIQVSHARSHDSPENTRDGNQGTAKSSDFVVLKAIDDIHKPRPAPRLPCRMFPPQQCLRNFKGRLDILQEIRHAFSTSSSPGTTSPNRRIPRSFALYGTPGMGKTSIASVNIFPPIFYCSILSSVD